MREAIALRARARRACALVVIAGLAAAAGFDSSAAAEDPQVIAESPRARITLDDFQSELAKLPPASRSQFTANGQRVVQFLNNLYLNRAVANDARAAGLDRDPVIARQIQAATDKILAQAQFDRVDRRNRVSFDANPDAYLPRARELYLANAGKYRVPESVHVSHILVKVGDSGEDAAKTAAEVARAKAAAGAPFAELARQISDDASAKRNGGDLGFVARGKLDPAFAAAAFALRSPGELSPVTKSALGYHVILLHARKDAAQRTFDEVKKEILAEVRQALIESERALYQGSMFTDPAPKVNEALIAKIVDEARASATPIEGLPRTSR